VIIYFCCLTLSSWIFNCCNGYTYNQKSESKS